MNKKSKGLVKVFAILLAAVMSMGIILPVLANADETVEAEKPEKPEKLENNVINIIGNDGEGIGNVAVDFVLARKVESQPEAKYEFLKDENGKLIVLNEAKTNELGQIDLEGLLNEDHTQVYVTNTKLVRPEAGFLTIEKVREYIAKFYDIDMEDEKLEEYLDEFNFAILPNRRSLENAGARYENDKFAFISKIAENEEAGVFKFDYYNDLIPANVKAYTKEPTGVNNEIEEIKDGGFVLTYKGETSIFDQAEDENKGSTRFDLFADKVKLDEKDGKFSIKSDYGFKQVRTAEGYAVHPEEIKLSGDLIQEKIKDENNKETVKYFLEAGEDVSVEVSIAQNVIESGKDEENPKTEIVVEAFNIKVYNSEETPEEPAEKDLQRLAGDNRFKTAVEISRETFDSADTVVLASGLNTADALAAGPLAINEDAPILLTGEELSGEAKAEILRLKADNVIIVGGPRWIPEEAAQELKDLGLDITRIAGENRFETSVNIAEHMKADSIILADAGSAVDALAVSGYAKENGLAIVLTDSEELSAEVEEFIKKDEIAHVEIVGGKMAVSEEIEKELGDAFAGRIQGENRFETAIKLAEKAYGEEAKEVVLVNASKGLVDALAAAPYASKNMAPILLTEDGDLHPLTKAYLKEGEFDKLTVIGGLNSVGANVEKDAFEAIK